MTACLTPRPDHAQSISDTGNPAVRHGWLYSQAAAPSASAQGDARAGLCRPAAARRGRVRPNWEIHAATVDKVIEQLGAQEIPRDGLQ
ncbi:MAG: hypothetical protein ACLUDG_00470 [Butyricicoccus sp.]